MLAEGAQRRRWNRARCIPFKSIYSRNENFTSNTLFMQTHKHTERENGVKPLVPQSVSRRTVIDFPILIEWMQFDDDKSFTFDWIELNRREAQIMRPEGTVPCRKRNDCNWEKLRRVFVFFFFVLLKNLHFAMNRCLFVWTIDIWMNRTIAHQMTTSIRMTYTELKLFWKHTKTNTLK